MKTETIQSEKRYEVIVASDYIDADGCRYQNTQLVRDGKSIGSMNFKDGVNYGAIFIDGIGRELTLYFMDESRDVLRLQPTLPV